MKNCLRLLIIFGVFLKLVSAKGHIFYAMSSPNHIAQNLLDEKQGHINGQTLGLCYRGTIYDALKTLNNDLSAFKIRFEINELSENQDIRLSTKVLDKTKDIFIKKCES